MTCSKYKDEEYIQQRLYDEFSGWSEEDLIEKLIDLLSDEQVADIVRSWEENDDKEDDDED